MGIKGKKITSYPRKSKNRQEASCRATYKGIDTPLIGPVYRLFTQKFFTTHIPIIGDSSIFAPDLQKQRRNMAYVINDDCVACGSCIDECPVEAISEGKIYLINPQLCTDCGSCAAVCPSEAIHPAAV